MLGLFLQYVEGVKLDEFIELGIENALDTLLTMVMTINIC
jgi:hypothetical protein